MWKVFILMFVVVGLISYLWVRGINYVTRNHPDYKDDNLFGEFNENDKDNLL